MNVLVVGGGSWDDTTSLGNTLSNFFGELENVDFYNLYFRETLPNNKVCTNYFRITTKELLKNFLNPPKNGKYLLFETAPHGKPDDAGIREKKAISAIHRYNLKAIYDLEDFLWYTGKWKNEKLDHFLDMCKPDIIFSFAAGNSYMVLPIEYIKKKTGAKLVLFVADDMHTTYRIKNDSHTKRMRRDFDKLMMLADKVYGVSEELCEYYRSLYHICVTPLYKGCSIDAPIKTTVNDPVRLIYAGNLLFGRDTTLIALVDALDSLNKDKQRAVLDIYSGTLVTDAVRNKLNRKHTAVFHGKRSYEEIKEQMCQADIVLHIESFEEDNIPMVRYSLSTKIIDCLQSGSVMLTIGPKGISSVEYPRKIPGVIVIDNINDLSKNLQTLLDKPEYFPLWAEQTRQYAEKHHGHKMLCDQLLHDFNNIISEQ